MIVRKIGVEVLPAVNVQGKLGLKCCFWRMIIRKIRVKGLPLKSGCKEDWDEGAAPGGCL
jgi:hypothetical protein